MLRAVVMGLLTLVSLPVWPQGVDLLLRGGRVIDPHNEVDAQLDVAITDGKIVEVGAGLDTVSAQAVVDVSGLIVVPGLVDLHAHVFHGTEPNAAYSDGPYALPPDGFSFRVGVTTVVDTGGSGWRNFIDFKKQVIDRSETRVLAFLNIVGSGMKGGPIEQNLTDMDSKLTSMRVLQFPEHIVGVKVAHYQGAEWDPVDRALAAAREASVPVMVDFGNHTPELSLESLLLNHLRSGDILTHTYADVRGRTPIVGEGTKIREFVPLARERGVVFDVGHGAGSFLFRQVVPATEQGFYPDTISTDLHRASMNAGMKDLLNVMSKFLNLGMSLPDVVAATTSVPARVIGRETLGHLSVGAEADLAVLNLREGSFGFVDSSGQKMLGAHKLACELTLRSGRIVWDLNGLSHAEWNATP